MSSGKTLTAVWAMRNVRETLTPTERHVLHAFFSFMNAAGVASPGHAALIRETGYVKRTIISAIEGLVRAGLLVVLAESQLVPVKRCAVYKVVVEAIEQSADKELAPVSPEHSIGDPSSENVINDHVQVILDLVQCDPGSPFEDLDEEVKRNSEDTASPSLAPSPPLTSPTTSRSPQVTMLNIDAPLPTAPAIVEAPKRKRASKPKLAPLTVEALAPYEREVHDAIVNDPTLVLICQNVPQLARDLVAIANDRIDVVAKVKALGIWNRNNPSKAWTTAGGNRGLTGCITRDAAQGSFGYSPTRPSPNVSAANGIREPAPPTPQVVDFAKNPELMARPMRTARFE